MRTLRRTRAPFVAVALSLVALAGCNDADPTGGSATDPGAPTQTPTGSPTSTDDPTSEPTGGTETTGTAAPVYFAGATPQGTRLFREFRAVEGDALTAAAELVDGGIPLDPDYRTLWPGDVVESVNATPEVITVELGGDAFTDRPEGMRRKEASLALQQMLHTLQGVTQTSAPVQFHRASGPQTLFGVDVSAPVTRADFLDVLGMVNVTTPEQGAKVSGGELSATGVASSFEATVPWQVRRGDEVVLEGFATADGWMDKLYPWAVVIDVSGLDAGDYTFVAMTDDPSGGEGAGPTSDTKDFTVS